MSYAVSIDHLWLFLRQNVTISYECPLSPAVSKMSLAVFLPPGPTTTPPLATVPRTETRTHRTQQGMWWGVALTWTKPS